MSFQADQIKREILRYIFEGRASTAQPLPTISAMAQTFGVSNSTVQKAIHDLSEEGVLRAVRGKGIFVRSLDPRARSGKRIGLLSRGSRRYLDAKPFPFLVVEGLRAALAEQGYELVLCPRGELKVFHELHELKALGLAGLVTFEMEDDNELLKLRELLLPLVSLDYDAFHLRISSAVFDNRFGTFAATRHLIGLGHRRILFLHPLVSDPHAEHALLDRIHEERWQGYRLAMQDAGLPILEEAYLPSRPPLRDLIPGILARRRRPTAMVCVNDHFARHVADEAAKLGFAVPEDLSVAGFGDTELSLANGLRVASVKADYEGMGREGARLIREALGDSAAPFQRSILPVRFLPHQTVAPAGAPVPEAMS